MSIRSKLLGCFLIMIAIVATSAIVTYSNSKKIDDETRSLVGSDMQQVNQVMQLRMSAALLNTARAQFAEAGYHLAIGDNVSAQESIEEAREARTRSKAAFEIAFESLAAVEQNSPSSYAFHVSTDEINQKYNSVADSINDIDQAFAAGDTDPAIQILAVGLESSYEELDALLSNIEQSAARIGEDSQDAILGLVSDINRWNAALYATMAIVGLALALGISRSITKPARVLSSAAQQIAEGNFDILLPAKSGDELGHLSRTFNQMAKRLRELQHAQMEENERRRKTTEELNDLFETAADGFCVIDTRFNVLRANKALTKLLGIDRETMRQKKCYEILSDDLCHTPNCPICRIQNGEARVEFETEKHNGDGTTIPCILAATPLRNREGETVAMLAGFKDISERKRMERIEGEAKTLKDVDRLRREVISIISHELRTPLTTVKGYATLLLDEDVTLKKADSRRYLESIVKSADNLVDMLNNVLDVSRMEVGMLQLEKTTINISTLMQEIAFEVRLRSPGHSVLLELPETVPMVDIDPRRIRQVIDNLLDNAAKYSEEGTEITVAVRRNGPELIVSVSDHGIGVAPGYLTKIFDRMYRTRQASAKTRGAGLGLAISKGLVEMHGGKIWMESKAGNGSTCSFTIPLQTA